MTDKGVANIKEGIFSDRVLKCTGYEDQMPDINEVEGKKSIDQKVVQVNN